MSHCLLSYFVSHDPIVYTMDESVHRGRQTPGGGKFRSSISPAPSLHSASTLQKGSHVPSPIHLSSQSTMLESSLTAIAKSPAKAPVSRTNLSLAAVVKPRWWALNAESGPSRTQISFQYSPTIASLRSRRSIG